MAAIGRLYAAATCRRLRRARPLHRDLRSMVLCSARLSSADGIRHLLAERATFYGDTDLAEQLAGEAFEIDTTVSRTPPSCLPCCTRRYPCRRGTMGEMVPVMGGMASALPAFDPKVFGGFSQSLTPKLATTPKRPVCWKNSRRLTSTFLEAPHGWSPCSPTQMPPPPLGTRSTPEPCSTGSPHLQISGGYSGSTWRDRSVSTSVALPRSSVATTKQAIISPVPAESCAAGDVKFYAARTNLSWGQMLAERGGPSDTEHARDLVTKAHSVAAANGYGNVERRAAAALLLLGG